MSDNPHHEEAEALLADNPGEYEIEKSKALATLALAYEQRTANLIALYGAPDLEQGLSTTQWSDALKQVKERLGLA